MNRGPAHESKIIPVAFDRDVLNARKQGREMAATLPFSRSELTMIATAISELARNIVSYASRGSIEISLLNTSKRQGLQIIARDQGPGIIDIDQALQDGFSTGNSLGLGLPGVRRMMDDFSIESTPEKGTTVVIRKWITRRSLPGSRWLR